MAMFTIHRSVQILHLFYENMPSLKDQRVHKNIMNLFVNVLLNNLKCSLMDVDNKLMVLKLHHCIFYVMI